MDALLVQMKHELLRFKVTYESIETLFIGGGTPSTVSPKLFTPLFELLKPYFEKNIEITSEANPNSATYEWLEGMYALGVNRISFGVQSFNAQKLKLLNRAHSPQQAINAITNATKVGFKNLSLDLIYATLGDTQELLKYDLDTAFSLPINHISAYALTIEEGTAFFKRPHLAQEHEEITEWLFEKITQHGFKQYEISNFGSYVSQHNLGYWYYKDYIGVGSGAVAKLKSKRFYPHKEIELYIKNPLAEKEESLSDEDIKIEKILLGLRSCIGVQKNILNAKELKNALFLTQEKKLFEKNEIFYNYNYLLADEIALFIST